MEKTFANYEIHGTLLGFILSEKTGYIQTQPGDRKLFFENGHLVFAKSGEQGENFADILVEMGKISDTQLAELKESMPGGESLGKALREKGFATPKDLGAALKHQIMRIITKVLMVPEGITEIFEEDLPQKMPKLKISTLPLFVKNILLIDAPDFPSEIQGEHRVDKTDLYTDLLSQINLPDHFQPIFDQFHAPFTTADEPKNLDLKQFKKVLYIFKLLGMIELTEIEEERMSSGDDPFDQLGLPYTSPVLLESDSEDVFGLDDMSDEENLFEHDVALELDDFNPLGDLEDDGPMDQDEFLPSGSLENELLPDSLLEESLSPDESLEDNLPLFDPNDEDSLDDNLLDEVEEDEPVYEDPIEALHRALAEPETPTLAMELSGLGDNGVLVDQNETVPGESVDDLREGFGESDPEFSHVMLEDGPTIPGKFKASDLEPSQPLSSPSESSLDIIDQQTENDESMAPKADFILPDDEGDTLDYFEKKRTWPYIIIPAAIIVIAGLTYMFRDRIPFLNKSSEQPVLVEGSNTTTPEPTVVPASEEPASEESNLETTEPVYSESENTNPEPQKSIIEDTDAMEEPVTAQSSEATTQEPEPEEQAPVKKTKQEVAGENSIPDNPTDTAPSAQGQSIESLIATSRDSFKASTGTRYTLVFMVACERETVGKVISKYPDGEFYIVERLSHGNLCYCLATGNYATHKEAEQARSTAPEGILAPGERPWILKISK